VCYEELLLVKETLRRRALKIFETVSKNNYVTFRSSQH